MAVLRCLQSSIRCVTCVRGAPERGLRPHVTRARAGKENQGTNPPALYTSAGTSKVAAGLSPCMLTGAWSPNVRA